MNSEELDGDALRALVIRAQKGDKSAVELMVKELQPGIYNLAVRFLAHPQNAEDATQEILIRIITRLSTFRGDSNFRTWTYRVSTNHLLTLQQRPEYRLLDFKAFGDDLVQGLADDKPFAGSPTPYDAVLLNEVRVGCTLAMLQCLDADHRLVYILGEIFELDHNEGARVLELSSAGYRKRLSRARAKIIEFVSAHCGLVEPANRCRCSKRASTAVALNRVDPENLIFTTSPERARTFPKVLEQIRVLEAGQRAAALYRTQERGEVSDSFTQWLRQTLVAIAVN